MPRPTFDHAPLLLDCGGMRRGLTHFRFENMWLKVLGFQDMLEGWWQGLFFRGSASYILSRKLKEVKSLLKTWNRDCFGTLDLNKKLALSQVKEWDSVEEVRVLTMKEAKAKKEAKDSFKKWVSLEEIYWRQKSRETWLKASDRNIGFFHRIANFHFRKNTIARIKINGDWISDE